MFIMFYKVVYYFFNNIYKEVYKNDMFENG